MVCDLLFVGLLIVVMLDEVYVECNLHVTTPMINVESSSSPAAHFTNDANHGRMFLDFDRDPDGYKGLPHTLRFLFKGKDKCFIPLLSWSNYKLEIDNDGRLWEYSPDGNTGVQASKSLFVDKVGVLCSADWKWFTLYIYENQLHFTIHDTIEREHKVIFTSTCDIKEPLTLLTTDDDTGDKSYVINRTPFIFDNLVGTVGQIQFWDKVHDNNYIKDEATLTINRAVMDRGELTWDSTVDFLNISEILSYHHVSTFLVTCPAPLDKHATRNPVKTDHLVNEHITVQCEENFMLENKTTNSIKSTCKSSGDWDPAIPLCISQARCSLPPYTYDTKDFLYYTEADTLYCRIGLTLYTDQQVPVPSGTLKTQCLVNEQLTVTPKCGVEQQLVIELDDIELLSGMLIKENKVVEDKMLFTNISQQLQHSTADEFILWFSDYTLQRTTTTGVQLRAKLIVIPTETPYNTLSDVISSSSTGIQSLRSAGSVTISSVELIDTDQCPGIIEENGKGKYKWGGNETGATSQDGCAKATCTKHQLYHAWVTDYTNCSFTEHETQQLDDLNKEEIDNIENFTKSAVDIIQNITTPTTDQYDIAAKIVEKILSKECTPQVNNAVLDIIDKFSQTDEKIALIEQGATERYLHSLDTVLGRLELNNGSKSTNLAAIKFALLDLPKEQTGNLKLRERESGLKIYSIDGEEEGEEMGEEEGIAVDIPSAITKTLGAANRFYFVVFEKPIFFITKDLFTGKQKLGSKVFSAGVTGQKNIRGIQPKIRIELNTANMSGPPVCVYWRDGGNIREREIKLIETDLSSSSKERAVCQTDHLTSFAVLMSSKEWPGVHEEILSIITYIGCSLSIIGLVLALIGLAVFKSVRAPIATKIHLNMCVALLCGVTSFMVGVEQTDNSIICLVFGLLIHYFILSAIFWMGIEGFHLYMMIVKVFSQINNLFVLKCAAFAWGVPLVIVGVTVGWNPAHYNTVEFCWLTRIPMICSFFTPAMIVIVLNTYMFVKVVSEIHRAQSRMKKDNLPSNSCQVMGIRDSMIQVRAAISIMVLLGVTWSLGALCLFNEIPAIQLPAMYLFSVCNSLQGFLFFFFHCAIKTDVKERWKSYLGLEISHSKLSELSKTYDSNHANIKKGTEFTKLGDSATSLNKSLLSFKPKFNKVRPESPDGDSTELAVVDF